MVSISRLYDLLPFLFAGCLDGCRGFSHSCHLFNPTNTECQLCPLALTERWQFSGEQKAHMLCPVVKYLRARLNPSIGAQDVAQELCFLLLHFPPLCPLAPSLPHLALGLADSATQ